MKGRRFWSGLTVFALTCALGWTQARVEWLLPTLQPYSLAVNDTGTHCAVTMGFGALGWMNLTTGVVERLFLERGTIERADVWGDLLAYVTGNEITLRQISTGAVIRRWQARGSTNDPSILGVVDLRFSPDGQLIGAACRDFRVRIWRVSDGVLRFTLNHAYNPTRLAFSANGQWIATADDFGRVLLWSRATGALVSWRRYHTAPVVGLVFAPISTWLASTARYPETGLSLMDVSTYNQVWRYNIGEEPTTLEFAPDNDTMFIGTARGRILRWRTMGTPLPPLQAHSSVLATDLSGTLLVSGSLHGTYFLAPPRVPPAAVQVWDTATGNLLATHHGNPILPTCVAITPDGERLAVGDGLGNIRWYTRTGAILREWRAHNDAITSLSLSPDGARLVSGATDGTVRVWDTATDTLVHDLSLPGGVQYVNRVAVSRDGAYVAALGYRNPEIPVWDLHTGALVNTLYVGDRERGAPMAFDFTPDSTGIAVVGTGNLLRIVDLVSGAITQEIEMDGQDGFVVRYSPDGQVLLVSVASPGLTLVWDVATGAFVKRLGVSVQEAIFSPDSNTVIFPWQDTVYAWDWRESPEQAELENHTRRLFSLYGLVLGDIQMEIAPNGRRVYVVASGAGVGAWRLPPFADVDGNGCVDDADLLTVLFNFGATGPNAADVNHDGTVDDADLLEVLFNFGQGC